MPQFADRPFGIGENMMCCPADTSRTQALEVRRKARDTEQHERAECGASHADRDEIFAEICVDFRDIKGI
jgi:hypothetical protein